MTRNADFNRIAGRSDGITQFESLELVSGGYNDLGDPTDMHEDSRSILVTHRVDQVVSRKTDQVPRAE